MPSRPRAAGLQYQEEQVVETASFDYETGGNTDVWLQRIRPNGPQEGTIGPRPDHVVFWLTDGAATLTSDTGETEQIGANQPTMLSAPAAYAFRTNTTRTSLLHLRPGYIQSVSRRDFGDDAAEFQSRPHDDVRAAPLAALLIDAGPRILDPRLPDDEREALNRRIATAVITSFTRARSDVESRLRIAIEFIHDHAGDDLTVGDIAAAAALSERGLQDLFRRSFDVTPMRYLREVRLDRAHLELTQPVGRPRVLRVNDVAQRWRFTHLGRFAAMYRARFGIAPHESIALSDAAFRGRSAAAAD